MAQAVELAKRRYSQELAAYTHNQWRSACRALEQSQNNRNNAPHVNNDEGENHEHPRIERHHSDETYASESDAEHDSIHVRAQDFAGARMTNGKLS